MWLRKRRTKRVVQTITVVAGKGLIVPIYLLDDGSVVWKLSEEK